MEKTQRVKTYKLIIFLFILVVLGILFAGFIPKEGEKNIPNKEASKILKGRSCYAERVEANPEFGKGYSYSFVSFTMESGQVRGVIENYPYGTDSMRGSFAGTFNPLNNTLKVSTNLLAEGTIFQDERSFNILGDAITLGYKDIDGQMATLAQVPCEIYDKMYTDFQSEILDNIVNSTDTSRLMAIGDVVEAVSIGAISQVANLSFLERRIDLDNDYQTEEYLVYINHAYLCGTGGCNLYIIDGEGETLSKITVVRLPVYSTANLAPTSPEEMKGRGWRDLIVWSDGAYRRVAHDGNNYQSNPSLLPEIPQEEILGHPEEYIMLFDYLDPGF